MMEGLKQSRFGRELHFLHHQQHDHSIALLLSIGLHMSSGDRTTLHLSLAIDGDRFCDLFALQDETPSRKLRNGMRCIIESLKSHAFDNAPHRCVGRPHGRLQE